MVFDLDTRIEDRGSLIAGCSGRTAILIEITSSLPVPDAVDALELRIDGLESGASLERSFLLDAPFPHTFSVLPAEPMEPVVITITARHGERFVLRRVVGTTFRAGTEVVAPARASRN